MLKALEVIMQILEWFESVRTPVLDALMLFLTRCGEEAVFLLIAVILFWCVDKREGYYIMMVGFFGTVLNQWLKLAFRVPRPWVRDPSFTIVERARAAATGYSFPSGHTQIAVGIYGALAVTAKRKWLRAVCIALAVLVPVSRMYLGVHTPLDVGVAALLALALVLGLYPLLYSKRHEKGIMAGLLAAGIALALAALLFSLLYAFPADTDVENLLSGREHLAELLGACLAMAIAYAVDSRYLHFETRAPWYLQIIKVALGLVLTLGVKVALKAPLNALCGTVLGGGVRYFFVLLVAALAWPSAFAPLCRLAARVRDRRDPPTPPADSGASPDASGSAE